MECQKMVSEDIYSNRHKQKIVLLEVTGEQLHDESS